MTNSASQTKVLADLVRDSQKAKEVQAVLDGMSEHELTQLAEMVRYALAKRQLPTTPPPTALTTPPPVASRPPTYVGNVLSEVLKGSGLQHDSRWQQWAKWIDRVDMTQSTGYAFVGDFIREGTSEVVATAPRLALVKRTTGSRAHQDARYRVVIWHPDGTVEPTDIQTDDSPGWALRLRAKTMSLLEQLRTGTLAHT